MNADDRVTDAHAPAHDTSQRNPPKIIAVVQVRHEHLEKRLCRDLWRWDVLHNDIEKRRHVLVAFLQLADGKSILRTRVDDWKIQLLVGCFQFYKKVEHHVDD